MFTLEQIRAAHGKVKSGANFPQYVQDMKDLGIKKYEHYVADGHIQYYGSDTPRLDTPAKWEVRSIAPLGEIISLKQRLKIHQQGGTDYMTFCEEAARLGVEKWTVDIEAMTCTYYDSKGASMLEELIPAP